MLPKNLLKGYTAKNKRKKPTSSMCDKFSQVEDMLLLYTYEANMFTISIYAAIVSKHYSDLYLILLMKEFKKILK